MSEAPQTVQTSALSKQELDDFTAKHDRRDLDS